MRISLRATPAHLETLMIKMVINDILTIFFVLTLLSTGVIVMSGMVGLQTLLVIIPTVAFVCAFLAVMRFYGYISVLWKIFGSFKRSFVEFDLKEADMTVDFNPPFILFKSLLNKYAQKTAEKPLGYVVVAHSETDKYSLDETCEVVKGSFRLSLVVTDWHEISHQKLVEGRLSNLRKTVQLLVMEIRREVLEARGVDVSKLQQKARESISFPSLPPTPLALPLPKIPVPLPLSKLTSQTPPPKQDELDALDELAHSLELLEKLKKAEHVHHKVHRDAHEDAMKKHIENAKTEQEKKELLDALYQLEEINKFVEGV